MNVTDFRHSWTLEDGNSITVRPIRPEDADSEQEFVRKLSPSSKYLRFFSPLKELSPAALHKFTHNTYPTAFALIATVETDGRESQIGVARFAPGSQEDWAEFAIVVADGWQGKGIATQLLLLLFNVALTAGIKGVEGLVLRENSRMLDLSRQLGFAERPDDEDPHIVRVRKKLG